MCSDLNCRVNFQLRKYIFSTWRILQTIVLTPTQWWNRFGEYLFMVITDYWRASTTILDAFRGRCLGEVKSYVIDISMFVYPNDHKISLYQQSCKYMMMHQSNRHLLLNVRFSKYVYPFQKKWWKIESNCSVELKLNPVCTNIIVSVRAMKKCGRWGFQVRYTYYNKTRQN